MAIVAAQLLSGSSNHTVSGTLQMTANQGGIPCHGVFGYDDIVGGAQVRVKDGSGKTIAVGQPGEGRNDSQTGLGGCLFAFMVSGVPDAAVYEVSIGNQTRSGPQYTKAQMSDMKWTVTLTLGG